MASSEADGNEVLTLESIQLTTIRSLRNPCGNMPRNLSKNQEKNLPSFNMHRCFSHFYQTFKALCPNRIFLIPDWIPRLATPTIQFNTSPPTYREITNIIRKMKTSGSPCPLDQISIIALKRSSYLRTYLTEIVSQAWKAETIPDTWKKAVTILIHNNNNNYYY